MERCCSTGCVPLPGNIGACSQRYRSGSVGCAASRTPDACDQIWRRHPDTRRRRLSSASILVADRLLRRAGHPDLRHAAKHPLQCKRDGARAPLPDDPRARTDRDHTTPAADRRVISTSTVCRAIPRPPRSVASCCVWPTAASRGCGLCTTACSTAWPSGRSRPRG